MKMVKLSPGSLVCACINLLWITSLSHNAVLAGSCREAQLCCTGRDSSCVVQKAPINAIIEDLSDKPCYCDHACLKLGDCCEDFKDHCGVLDCQVSEWDQWTECDKSCGTGMMTRSRTVIQPTQNGGKHCPSLVQKRGCQGFRCHGHHDRKVLREMALLLPAALSRNRHANDSSDIRRNLRLRYRDSFKHNRDHEYCVEYEVIKASKACHKLPPYNQLLEGDRVVVRCDLEALIEDSPPNADPNTSHTGNSNSTKSTSNRSNSRKSEITNNSAVPDDDEEEDVDEESEDYDRSSTTTTTTTTTTPAPATYHCRGEGLAGRTTRWSALPAPSCRGKWLRLTVGQPKKCSHSQFIFV